MNITMANSSTIQADLEVTSKNLRPTMRMGWRESSRLVTHLSIQMDDSSSFLPISILMPGKRLYLLLYVLVSLSMEVGQSKQRWATEPALSHRLRWRPLSG